MKHDTNMQIRMNYISTSRLPIFYNKKKNKAWTIQKTTFYDNL